MTRILTISCIVTTLGLVACSGPDPVAPGPALFHPGSSIEKTQGQGEPMGHYLHANREALSRQTFQNAYKLERAFWKYAAENDGAFTDAIWKRNLAGKTILDYLPGKVMMRNPFTRMRTEPRFGFALGEGSISFLDIRDNQGYQIGFAIWAMGAGMEQTLEIVGYMPGMEDPEPRFLNHKAQH